MRQPQRKSRSLKQRLLLFALYTTAPAVFVCWAAQAVSKWLHALDTLPPLVAARAELVARNAAAALTFNDAKDATATLATLRGDPRVDAAFIFTADGREFARYIGPAGHEEVPQPPAVGEPRFSRGSLHLAWPVILDGERVGSVYLQYDLHELYREVLAESALFGTVAFLALGFGAVLARRFRRSIVDPIQQLASTATHVAAVKDYSVRTPVDTDDELGVLTDAFNHMLEEIQTRDAELTLAKATLEQRVKERTAALQTSEERIRELVQDVNGIVWEADAKTWEFTFVSERAEAILGYPVSRWMTEPGFWVSILHPDDRHWAIELCCSATAAGEDHEFVYRAIAADGRVVWLHDVVRTVTGESGPEKLRGLMVDVTERKKAEDAARAATDVLRLREHALERLASGASLEQVLGTVVSAIERQCPGMLASVLLLDEAGRHLLHGVAPGLPDEYNRAIHGFEIGPEAGSCGTAAFLGERVIVEDIATDPLWTRFRDLALQHGLRACWSQPFFSKERRVLGTLALYYREARRPSAGEIGAIEAAAHLAALAVERNRVESEQRRLALAFVAAADSIVLTDPEGRIIRVNPAFTQITGYSHEEASGQTPRLLKSGEHPPEFYKDLWDTIRGGRVWSGRVVDRRKDGSHYHAALTIAPIVDEDGKISGYVGAQRDVTADILREQELCIARDAAEAANRAKSEFLANMSHEIRTPMNAILGFTELTLDTELTETQREYLKTVVSGGNTLLTLLNDILDFSKIEAGKLQLESADFDVIAETEGVLDLVRHRAAGRALELVSSIDPATPRFVRGDPLRLRQVLLNLLANAVKFTESGEVVVGIETEQVTPGDVTLRFSISDTGIGIPRDRLGVIFESFTQADGATTRKYGGSGLGLAICKQLVALMGGTIEVESEVGCGSTFTFRIALPRGAAPAGAAPRDCADETMCEVLRDRRILVVDDNATCRHSLQRLLRSWRCESFVAASAADALDELGRATASCRPIGIVLLDAQMPAADGAETARLIRRDERGGHPAIVLMTALGQDSEIAAGGPPSAAVGERTLGPVVDAYLCKPIKQAQLAATLVSLVTPAPRAAGPSGPSATKRERGAASRRGSVGSALGDRRSAHQRRVLLVEDNVINRHLAKGILDKLRCAVFEAENGQRALDALEHGVFDLVLMDVQMPVLDGLAATARIRADRRWKDIPIIAMTAHAMRGDRERCLAAGMNAYLTKPITIASLRGVVDRWAPDGNEQVGTSNAEAPADPEPVRADPDRLVTPGDTPTSSSDRPPIDVEEALLHLGGDHDLLREVLAIIVKTMPELVEQCRTACSAGDSDGLKVVAHTLKGTAANVCAEATRAVAAEIERFAKEGRAGAAASLVAELDEQLARIRDFAGTLGESVEAH